MYKSDVKCSACNRIHKVSCDEESLPSGMKSFECPKKQKEVKFDAGCGAAWVEDDSDDGAIPVTALD